MTIASSTFPNDPNQCVANECPHRCCIADFCGNIIQCNEWILALIIILGGTLLFCLIIFIIWSLQNPSSETVTPTQETLRVDETGRQIINPRITSSHTNIEMNRSLGNDIENTRNNPQDTAYTGYNIRSVGNKGSRLGEELENVDDSNMGNGAFDQWGGLEEIKEENIDKSDQAKSYNFNNRQHKLNRDPEQAHATLQQSN